MNIIDGQFNSMPGDHDFLEAGTHTGRYSGFLVVEDVTVTAMTTYSGTVKTDTFTLSAGVTFQCAFSSITISGGTIIAYKD